MKLKMEGRDFVCSCYTKLCLLWFLGLHTVRKYTHAHTYTRTHMGTYTRTHSLLYSLLYRFL